MAEERLKFNLDEADIPAAWVNLMADLPGEALPPLDPRRFPQYFRWG